MRKVIPYIASQFRKDKIWLRRTKPSKRQYQICLAIDDSSSMIDNHSKQVKTKTNKTNNKKHFGKTMKKLSLADAYVSGSPISCRSGSCWKAGW